MGKSRDIADGTRYVDASGDTMTGQLALNTTLGSQQLRLKGVEADIWFESTGPGTIWRVLGSAGTNTHRFRVYDQSGGKEVLGIDSAGRVTTPYQPFLLLGTTGYTTANNAPLQFNQTYQSRNFSWSTASHSFTVPVTGVYTFSGATRLQTAALNYMYHRVQVNGANYPWNDMLILQKPNTADGFQTINTSFQVYLVASDSVQIQINYNGAGSYTVDGQSWLSVALLG